MYAIIFNKTILCVIYELSETLVFKHQSLVNENGQPPDSINRGTVLLEGREFSHNLAGTVLVQSNSVIVLGKTIVLCIVKIFHSSYFLFNVFILVGIKYLGFYLVVFLFVTLCTCECYKKCFLKILS